MLNSKKTVCYTPSGHIGLDELDIKQLKALANADFMPAVAALGNNYLWGCKGLKADTYKAIELLRKAAGTGDKLANESLGALFYRGHEGLDGVLIQNDKHQAYRVNLKAAKLGSRISHQCDVSTAGAYRALADCLTTLGVIKHIHTSSVAPY